LVTLDQALGTTREIVEQVHGAAEGRLSAYVGPSSLVSSDDDDAAARIATELLAIAAEHNTGIHAHAYRGMVRRAAAIAPDLLGPRTCLAHCAGIDDGEIELLAWTGTSASHGPLTHAYAEARFPVIEALEAGVTVAISTDGTSPDRSFDLLAQARIAAQLQRAHFGDTTLLPAGRLLAMITVDAASALGMADQIGSLEVGKRADVIVFDGGAPHLAPRVLAPHRLAHHACGADVLTVVCDGRVLMHDRVIPEVDRDRVARNAEVALRATLARTTYGDPDRLHPDFWHGLRYG
jgi:cytosine/adenosine deaminase-related metal-dependent hydrolase